VWFSNSGDNTIGRISPTGHIRVFRDGGINDPQRIITGPDGGLWFVNRLNRDIGRFTVTGTFTYYRILTSGLNDNLAITTGPDGTIWYSDGSNNTKGEIAAP
jgi:virginiamycin B lyase